MITLQYLEPGPQIAEITPRMAGDKLRAALDILPVDAVLLGWDLPAPLVEVCRKETARRGVKLYRWQPLLAGDGTFHPRRVWQTRNLEGEPIPGLDARPEFTFVCPNHPEARAAALSRLESVADPAVYDGVFFDRMRFPSPTTSLTGALGCFCPHCVDAAAEEGLDLETVRAYLRKTAVLPLFRAALEPDRITPFTRFLDFRQRSITRFVAEASRRVRALGLEVGLDVFSPLLTRLVGQDLGALPLLADWTKLMIYVHAFGPAALPYELGQLAFWLFSEVEFQRTGVRKPVEMPEDAAREAARKMFALLAGPESLQAEYLNARQMSPHDAVLLAGLEMVEIPAVCELTPDEIVHDLNVLRALGADGLAISWDLWHIPLERLELVREILG